MVASREKEIILVVTILPPNSSPTFSFFPLFYNRDRKYVYICKGARIKFADISIYVCLKQHTHTHTHTHTHIFTFKSTQTYAYLHSKENPPSNRKLTLLFDLLLKTFHCDEYIKRETQGHSHNHVIYIYICIYIYIHYSNIYQHSRYQKKKPARNKR